MRRGAHMRSFSTSRSHDVPWVPITAASMFTPPESRTEVIGASTGCGWYRSLFLGSGEVFKRILSATLTPLSCGVSGEIRVVHGKRVLRTEHYCNYQCCGSARGTSPLLASCHRLATCKFKQHAFSTGRLADFSSFCTDINYYQTYNGTNRATNGVPCAHYKCRNMRMTSSLFDWKTVTDSMLCRELGFDTVVP